MKFYLQLLDAWLEALEPWWKRVGFFCILLVGGSNLGAFVWGEDNNLSSYFWTGGMFGPPTYVLFGPVQLISIIAAGVVGFRFFHLQRGETLELVYVALLAAINTGFYNRDNTAKELITLNFVAVAVLAILFTFRYRGANS